MNAKSFVRALFRAYHVVRGPHLPSCRFVPSCSEYALEAVESHGVRKGGGLAIRRLTRCRPWGGWGVDPVPLAARADGRTAHDSGPQ